jgi:hypothetical protein
MLTVAFVTVAAIGLARGTIVLTTHRAEAAKSDSNKPVDGYDNPQGYLRLSSTYIMILTSELVYFVNQAIR